MLLSISFIRFSVRFLRIVVFPKLSLKILDQIASVLIFSVSLLKKKNKVSFLAFTINTMLFFNLLKEVLIKKCFRSRHCPFPSASSPILTFFPAASFLLAFLRAINVADRIQVAESILGWLAKWIAAHDLMIDLFRTCFPTGFKIDFQTFARKHLSPHFLFLT